MKSEEVRVLKKASLLKRIIAIIMDGAISIFVFFGLFLFVFSPISTNIYHYNDLVKEGTDLQIKSSLYVYLEEGDTKTTPIYLIEDKEISYYTERIHQYYEDFKVNIASDKDELIEGVTKAEYYTPTKVDEIIGNVLTVMDARNAAYNATGDFVKYVSDISSQIKKSELLMILPPFGISFGIFFFMIPLLFKNGETLGKKTMGIGLVSFEGYDVKKRQIIARQTFLFVLTTLISFYFTIGVGSFAFLGLGVAVYYILVVISHKTNRSIADYLAFTYMIDTKSSVWFKDPEEENKKLKIIEENLSKYNKVEAENKNVIQVGSEIVDPKLKEEFLKSNKEKK